jgi:hypothetical protein
MTSISAAHSWFWQRSLCPLRIIMALFPSPKLRGDFIRQAKPRVALKILLGSLSSWTAERT